MEILQLITHGEDSHTQFMVNLSNPEQLAQEFVVFSNTLGGVILVGVSDTGGILGCCQN
ncbi:MAG: ATP-binding protein [Gammaproteobacteria bacterium]|nr:ATP-binding protein [Gammaproteobacteria bacterium]